MEMLREEIREGIYRILQRRLWDMDGLLLRKQRGELSNDGLTMEINKLASNISVEILNKEHSQGVVIETDRTKPTIIFPPNLIVDGLELVKIIDAVRDTYDKAGYVAVELLIEGTSR